MGAIHLSLNNGTKLACGRNKGEVTTKWADVDCQKCKATRAFRDAYHQEVDQDFTPPPGTVPQEIIDRRNANNEITRVSPPLVRVTWESFSDFVREYPNQENLAIAGAISFGDELGLETWVDVRDNGPFYWKAGS